MPSLEIVCINQPEPSNFSRLPFTVESENELISHRSPKPLFQDDFDKLKGCIYHLLDTGGVTAYELLKRDWYREGDYSSDNIEFKNEYAPFVKRLLEQLLLASPCGQILFSTDYQFGPEGAGKYGPMLFTEFWRLYDSGCLRMNASYLITES